MDITTMTEKEIIQAMSKNPCEILNMGDIPEEIQIKAVSELNYVFPFIENPSRKVEIAAITHFPHNIKFIKNPDEEILSIALQKHGILIHYVEKPSETMQVTAIKENINSFRYIKKPTQKAYCELFTGLFNSEVSVEEFFLEDLYEFIKNREDHIFMKLIFQDEKEFFRKLPEYKNVLQEPKYFKALLHYFILFKKTWIQSYIRTLAPLTKEQEDIWKSLRMRTLV